MNSYKDEETLRKLYVDYGMSMSEVSDELNCSTDTVSRWVNNFGIDTGRLTDTERENISLSDYQKELVKGVLMGDGCIQRRQNSSHNPYFVVTMKNKEFIDWLSNELVDIVSSVKRRTGEYAETLDNPQWILKTYSHNLFREFADWYSTGKKRWPVNEEITETELKMLYVTDGSPVKHPENWAIKISAINECDRKEDVSEMFERDLDVDISWHSSDSETDGNIYIPSDSAGIIFKQEQVPGFEYKWPNSL